MSQPLRVLILEDRATDAELVVRELRRAGFDPQWQRVETEPDFTRALTTAPKVILADYSLPAWDAPAALAAVQARGADIPFLIVSGSIGEEEAVAAMRHGAADYLLKDRLGRLGAAVAQALERKRLRDEHQRDVERLSRSRDRFERIARAGNVGLWDWDLRTNEVFYSAEWKRQLGYAEEEIPNSFAEWESRVHPEDLAPTLAKVRALIASPAPGYAVEFRMRHKDGSYRWILAQADVLPDESGRPARMLGSHIDITGRKRAEESIRRLNAELEQRVSERTAELTAANQELESFSYAVSHDLRAPLRALSGFSQALVEDYGAALPEGARGYLEQITRASRRMAELVDGLLILSRCARGGAAPRPGGPLRPVRAHPPRAGAGGAGARGRMAHPARPRGARRSPHDGSDAEQPAGQRVEIHRPPGRARDPLLRRAGGRADVVLRGGQRGGLRHEARGAALPAVPAPAPAGGIPRHRHRAGHGAAHPAPPRRHDPGERRRRAGGHVQVFAARTEPPEPFKPMKHSKAILLVEDNPQDELLIVRSLRNIHLANHLDVVRDGQQALDYLFQEGEFAGRAGADLPAVVLLDINLPRVNGLEVLRQLRAHPRTRLLPVAILTSSDEERDRLRSYENGANSFVRKPIEFAEFAETVARLGIYWLLINQPPTD